MTSNLTGWTKQNPTITWAGITDYDWTGQQNTLKYIKYKIDSGAYQNLDLQTPPPSAGSAQIDVSALADGEHTIAVCGADNAGNIGASRTVTYKRDTTAPTISVSEPVEQSGLSGVVSIVGNVADPHLTGWRIEYGEGQDPQQWTQLNAGTTVVSNGELCVWNLTGIQSTDVKLRLTAWDQAGNQRQQVYAYIRSADGITSTPADLTATPSSLSGPVIIDATNPAFSYQRTDQGSTEGWQGSLYVDDAVKSNMTFDPLDFEEGSVHHFYIQSEDTEGVSHFSTTTYNEIAFSDELDNDDYIAEIAGAIRNANGTVTLADGSTTGTVISNSKTFAYPIKRVKITAQTNIPSGTTITFYASTDGGASWVPCTQDTFVNMQGLGKTLQVKAVLSTQTAGVTPTLDKWEAAAFYADPGQAIIISLVDRPDDLTVTANVNYTNLLRWSASTTEGVTYNVYRGASPDFTIGQDTLVASGIAECYWSDYKLSEENYGQTLYYKVCAVKMFGETQRISVPSENAGGRVVDRDELEKRLGLQSYWGYSQFTTGSGTGYINLSTGNLCYEASDFTVPGPLLAMTMRRAYNGQATSKTPLGYGWDFSFNTNLLQQSEIVDGQLVETGIILKDGDGTLHRFAKGAGGYESPVGSDMKLAYDTGTKTYHIRRDDNIEYVYNSEMRLQYFTEPNGNRLTLAYDARGNIASVTNSVNQTITFTYDNDLLATATDLAGHVYNYVYDDATSATPHLLSTGTYNSGLGTIGETFQYDAEGILKKVTNPNGKSTQFTNDTGTHAVVAVTDAVGEAAQIDYSPGVTSITTRGKTASFEYNPEGNITKVTDPLGHWIAYEYDASYNLTRLYYENTVNGSTVQREQAYTYFTGTHNIHTVTDEEGHTTEYRDYNAFNQPGTVVVPVKAGVTATTQYQYDAKEI